MNEQASLDIQTGQLWAETIAWLSNHSLQIILGFAAGTVLVLVLLGVRWIGVRICGTDPDHIHWRTVLGRVLAGSRLWFMIAFAARLVGGYAGAPPSVMNTIEVFFVIAATLQVALWARELILGVIEHRAGGVEESSGLGSAVGIIRLLVTIAIFVIALVVVLDNLGVNVTGLVAGLGIGGIAIGLAAQGIFADLFAAMAILFDRPFRRGDSIRWDTTSGTVEQIGLKSTRVRSISGEEVVISNKNLLDKELHNMARLNRRRFVQTFGIVYQTSPETCARIPELVRDAVSTCDKCVFLRCGLTGFGASSLDFTLEIDVRSEDWQEVFETRHEVLIKILNLFNAQGIAFAYPTQTSYTAAPDGSFVMPYPPAEGGEHAQDL